MKASELKKIADNASLNSDYRRIMEQIKAIAEKGKYECWVYENISDIVRDQLKKDGYEVGETQFDRNDTLTKISWNNA